MTPETKNQKPKTRLSGIRHPASGSRGYTLIELVIAVGVFAVIMMLASGSYFMMISVIRQTQATASGINNLSFAIETMTRTIRTGTEYSCDDSGDCTNGGSTFSVRSSYTGETVRYQERDGIILQGNVPLTDPSVIISSLTFYAYGTQKGNGLQPRVTFVISGDVISGAGKKESFTIESSATMRGTDI